MTTDVCYPCLVTVCVYITLTAFSFEILLRICVKFYFSLFPVLKIPRPTHAFKKKKRIFTGCPKQNIIPVTTGVLVESATDRPNPICSRPSPSTTDSELVPPKRISSSKRKLSKYLKD